METPLPSASPAPKQASVMSAETIDPVATETPKPKPKKKPAAKKKATQKFKQPDVREVTITIPLSTPRETITSECSSVASKILSNEQRQAFRELRTALRVTDSTLANGSKVEGNDKTIRWILEEIIAAKVKQGGSSGT